MKHHTSHRSAVSQPAYSAWIRYLFYPYTFSGPPEAPGSSSGITSRTSAVYKSMGTLKHK